MVSMIDREYHVITEAQINHDYEHKSSIAKVCSISDDYNANTVWSI